MMEFKDYIFDFGNVLYEFEPEKIFYKYTDSSEDVKLLNQVIFENWSSLDNGTEEYTDFINSVMGKLPKDLKVTARTMLMTWHRAIPAVNGMREIVEALKQKGAGVYMLSNAPKRMEDIFDTFPESGIFDDFIISGSVKMVKPEKRIYEYACRKFGVNPRDTLFIDDRVQNIEGAKEFGLNTYLFDGEVSKLKEYLKNYL